MTAKQPQESESTANSNIVSQLASIDRRLASLEAAQASISADHKEAHSKYLKELETYRRSRVITLVLRLVLIAVLMFIAYRAL